MKKLIFPILLLFASQNLFAQFEAPSKWQILGYQKFLNTTILLPSAQAPLPLNSDQFLLNDNLLHNRLKIKYFPSESWTINAEIRSRVFWGDQVRFTLLLGDDYLASIDQGSDDFFDWSWGAQNNTGYAFHTTLDRFYGEYSKGNWEVRLGRQRVNWGISTTWNPNDIFNAYNFVDFDYEERPGSDALRVKRYLGFASSVEIAVNAFDSLEEATAAMLAKFHTGTYDWQVLAGVVDENTVLGGGWAGNLGNASFKGEGAWFRPLSGDKNSSYAMALGIDYTFASQLYLNGGLLFNSLGETSSNADLFSFELSARNLYPFKYSVLLQGGYPINPLFNGAVVIVYSPGETHAMFLNPFLTYSLAQNWDLDLVTQIFFQKEDAYRSTLKAGFLRVKWSF